MSSESGNGISYTSEHRHKIVHKDCGRKKEKKVEKERKNAVKMLKAMDCK
jgi:hypothetical protein